MATEHKDLGEKLLALLRVSAAVTGLVVGSSDSVLEAGYLTGELLNANELTRRTNGTDKVLAVVVVDTGERGSIGSKTGSASVYLYDRQRGHDNIRPAREAIITALINQPVLLARDAYMVGIGVAGRTGFVQLEDFDLDYERVDFAGALTYTLSSELYA